MKAQIQTIVINYFLNSAEYEFKNFDMNQVIKEVEPLFKATLENYLYLKKYNPNNIQLAENSFYFVEPSKNKK
jgi:hypothetical protein